MEYHSGGSLPLLGRPRYCPGASTSGGYLCETGHCCGEAGCCTYYYELWWFWLLWTGLILFSCCCAYRHRRAKLRVQQQQRERSLLAYQGAPSYPSSMLDLSFLASLKLPSYEEVAEQPSTPPPPYSSVFTSPRYPQPPRCCDPHLLTQHGALLHRPLGDGPPSLSSGNSSSCSCDSCCPSSPCSSSLSAPITYETDTSHATTPSEATPLTLDVTVETMAAAARRLETQFVSETTAASDLSDEDAQDPRGVDPWDPDHTAPEGAGSDPLSSPGSQLDPHVAPPSEQRDSAAACRHAAAGAAPRPPIQATDAGAPAPTLKVASNPDPSAPSNSDKPASTHTLDLIDCTSVPRSPTPPPDPHPGPAPSNHIQPSDQTPVCPTPGPEPAPPDSTLSLDLPPVPDSPRRSTGDRAGPSPAPGPAPTELRPDTDTSAQGQNLDLSPASCLVPSPTSLDAAVPADPGLSLALFRSPVLALPTPAAPPTSCPAITVESDCLSPPPPDPALLLDPPSPLHASNRGRCSSAHASSLSPAPRATQSPPKQTLFSPCVGVFEAGPPSWKERRGEEEEEEEEEEDGDDVGADESQYKHRRLTGDSGIEVCRCRVEEEEEEEEEEEDGRTRGKWQDQKGGVATDLHDREDCPVRGRTTAGDDLCSPASTTAPTSMDKLLVVMETV